MPVSRAFPCAVDQCGVILTPAGYYLPEAAHPYHTFVAESGARVVFVSPAGGESPVDPGSVEFFGQEQACQDFLASAEVTEALKNTISAQDADWSQCDVSVSPGSLPFDCYVARASPPPCPLICGLWVGVWCCAIFVHRLMFHGLSLICCPCCIAAAVVCPLSHVMQKREVFVSESVARGNNTLDVIA